MKSLVRLHSVRVFVANFLVAMGWMYLAGYKARNWDYTGTAVPLHWKSNLKQTWTTLSCRRGRRLRSSVFRSNSGIFSFSHCGKKSCQESSGTKVDSSSKELLLKRFWFLEDFFSIPRAIADEISHVTWKLTSLVREFPRYPREIRRWKVSEMLIYHWRMKVFETTAAWNESRQRMKLEIPGWETKKDAMQVSGRDRTSVTSKALPLSRLQSR